MLVRDDSIPKPNIYSNKLLFEQGDNRNKKRIAQMLRRKTALSSKKEIKDNEKNRSPIKSPITLKTNKKDDSAMWGINKKNYEKNKNIDSLYGTDEISEVKLDNEDISDIKKHLNHESNIINLDCSPILSNNAIFNENNYYNNSSTNNSNNNSIINRDSQEKEVNISNLDNESVDDIIINKEDNNPEEECLNINKDNDKFLSKSLYNYEHDDDHMFNKEEKKIKEENEFALKYLTSSSDSFIQLDNHLVAKAKAQGGEMTESYFQALFPDLVSDSNKQVKNKNYEVTEIIKEEREIESPFGKTNYFSKKSSKTSRTSLDIGNIKKLKKSLVKTKSYAQLSRVKNNNRNSNHNKKIINDISLNTNNKNLKFKKNKTVSNFKNIKKVITKNNNEIKRNKNEEKKNEKLNASTSCFNLKLDKIKNNKMNLKINSGLIFNSTFSSNLYKKEKTEMRLNKNIKNQNNIKNSFTNLLDIEGELNDVLLIRNCVKKIGKSKNLKISRHYLKNINFYDKNKESDNKNKAIKKRNNNENRINKLNQNSTILTTSSKFNYFNTSNNMKKPKSVLKKDASKKNISKNLKNYVGTNKINKINNPKNKEFTHKICVSSFSFNEYINPKKYLTKKDRVKSFSRLILKNHQISDLLNTESSFRRTKSNHKKLITLTNGEHINTESSLMKIKTRKNNINKFSNNLITQKKKLIPFHKKNDYSYIKAKVKTGLSEEVLKKLLNNNKKFENKEINKKMEQDKKLSLLNKCKTSMNKTIKSFKAMASNIKKKLFKKDKNSKNTNNEEIHNNNINSSRNNKITKDKTFYSFKK